MIEHRQRIHRRWTEEADAKLRALVESGLFLPAIAIEMERTQEACRTRANILGIPVRSSAQRLRRVPATPPPAGTAEIVQADSRNAQPADRAASRCRAR